MLANRMMMGAAGVSTGIGGIDAYTVLMLHMDGTDDAQVFTDSSANEHTVTPVGDTKTENTQKKFGVTSGYFDGTGDYLTIPDSDDWHFGTLDFTVDFWIYFYYTNNTAYPGFFQQRENADNLQKFMYYRTDNELYYSVRKNGVAYSFFSGDNTFEPQTHTWYHIALVLNNETAYFYVDGIFIGSDNTPSYDVSNYSGPMHIGRITNNAATSTYNIQGYIDEFRISKGIARWTTNFTPPVVPYTT